MASSETNFEDRLRLYWPELKQRYMELYHDDKSGSVKQMHLWKIGGQDESEREPSRSPWK